MSTSAAKFSPQGVPPRIGTKYQIYKAATSSLAQWLAKQAAKLGVAFQKGHHKTNQGHGYGITIDQFRSFTDKIVNADPTVIVPYEIITLAQRASSVRKECAEILRGKDTDSDKRHEHFINVIDEVFERLQAHYRAVLKSKADQTHTAPSSKKGDLASNFDLLKVKEVGSTSENEASGEDDQAASGKDLDDITEVQAERKEVKDSKEDDDIEEGEGKTGKDHPEEDDVNGGADKSKAEETPALSKKSKANKKKKLNKARKAAERERVPSKTTSDDSYYLDEEEDPYFVMMCLLADLMSMRKFAKKMWTEYALNKMDLVTVSLTTNAMFDIIRTYEQDFPAISPLVKDYSTTLKLILGRRLGEDDKGLLCLFNPSNTAAQFDTMRSSLCWHEELVELACGNAFYFLNGPRHQMVWKKPDGSMGINLKRDPFGKYDPDFDRREKIYDDRLEHDIRILAAFAAGVYVSDTRQSLTPDHFTMQWDAFAQTGNKTVTLSEAFGAQLYLDIMRLPLADLSSAFLDVQGTANRVHLSMADFEKREAPRKWFKGNFTYKITSECLYTQHQIAYRTISDKMFFEQSMNALYKKAGKRDKFDMEKDLSFMERNPIMCGITAFVLLHSVRDSGMTLALTWRSILSAGQLYYATRMHREEHADRVMEEGVNPKWMQSKWKWDDMEYLFEMIGERAFFDGHLPASNHEVVMHNGTVKSLDTASGNIRQDGRLKDHYVPSMAPPKAGDRPSSSLATKYDLLTYEPIEISHRLYYAKYSTYHPSDEHLAVTNSWTEGSLLALLGKEAFEGGEQAKANASSSSADNQAISHLALLKALKRTLRKETRALRFDTLSFHLCCLDILRVIRLKLSPQIPELGPVCRELVQKDDDSKLIEFANKLQLAASSNEIEKGMWKVGEIPKEEPPFYTSKIHVAIDQAIMDYLEAYDRNDFEIRKIDMQYGLVKVGPREREYQRLRGMMMDLRSIGCT